MRARLSQFAQRRVRRGWLGHRSRLERVPRHFSRPSSMWLWVHLAPEYASLLPDDQGLALKSRGPKNYQSLGDRNGAGRPRAGGASPLTLSATGSVTARQKFQPDQMF